MSYADRKRQAVEHVGGLLADGRGDADYRDQLAAEQAAEDREYEDSRDANDSFSNSVKPSLKRALENAAESDFCRSRSPVCVSRTQATVDYPKELADVIRRDTLWQENP